MIYIVLYIYIDIYNTKFIQSLFKFYKIYKFYKINSIKVVTRKIKNIVICGKKSYYLFAVFAINNT